ncbi:hypothetical protein AFLA70_704g000351 [Aspergillus flavus AF70]|nr:hypothetical protein AFLA70_704g000351 [Aspergillus flavus AF70]
MTKNKSSTGGRLPFSVDSLGLFSSEASGLRMLQSSFMKRLTRPRSRISRASRNSLGKKQWSVSISCFTFDAWAAEEAENGRWLSVLTSFSGLAVRSESCEIKCSMNRVGEGKALSGGFRVSIGLDRLVGI